MIFEVILLLVLLLSYLPYSPACVSAIWTVSSALESPCIPNFHHFLYRVISFLRLCAEIQPIL